MAVAVEQAPYIVLDAEYRIVEVGRSAQATFGPLLGRDIFECFPDAASLYRPYYERARTMGEPVEFAQYYDGYAMLLKAEPTDDDRVVVAWQLLGMLDTMNLDALRLSLSRILARLEEYETGIRRDRGRAPLRLIEGGGR